MRAALCLLCAGLLPLPALACPATLADAGQGILVTYTDGTTARLTRDPATGSVTEDYVEPDGYRMLNEIGNGLHLLSWSELDAGGAVLGGASSTYVYTGTLPTEVTPALRWSVPYRITGAMASDGGTYSGQVGAQETLVIGPCSYAALPVTITLREETFTSLVRVDYIPALGLSLLRASGELGGETTVLTPASITAAPAP